MRSQRRNSSHKRPTSSPTRIGSGICQSSVSSSGRWTPSRRCRPKAGDGGPWWSKVCKYSKHSMMSRILAYICDCRCFWFFFGYTFKMSHYFRSMGPHRMRNPSFFIQSPGRGCLIRSMLCCVNASSYLPTSTLFPSHRPKSAKVWRKLRYLNQALPSQTATLGSGRRIKSHLGLQMGKIFCPFVILIYFFWKRTDLGRKWSNGHIYLFPGFLAVSIHTVLDP